MRQIAGYKNIIRSLSLAVVFGLCCTSLKASVIVNGPILKDTTWTSEDTILVTGFTYVQASAHLTIEPGTIVMVYSAKSLFVYGQLTACGEMFNRIVFTSSADTAGGSPSWSLWAGISMLENSSATMEYCDIRYATTCVYVDKAPAVLRGCKIENFGTYGFYADGYALESPVIVTIDSCTVCQTHPDFAEVGGGIFVRSLVDAAISNSLVYGCSNGIIIAAHHEFAPTFAIADCEIRDNRFDGIQMTYG